MSGLESVCGGIARLLGFDRDYFMYWELKKNTFELAILFYCLLHTVLKPVLFISNYLLFFG